MTPPARDLPASARAAPPALDPADAGLAAALRAVRLAVFDFDGVLTDNTVYVFEDGREAVRCWRGDGLGLQRLAAAGVAAAILSTETNPVVTARSRKLGVRCLQGQADKRAALATLAAEHGLGLDAVAYVGNDVNDLECLGAAGLAIVVADAHPAVHAAAAYRTRTPGGFGAVRELCDLIVAAQAQGEPAAQAPQETGAPRD